MTSLTYSLLQIALWIAVALGLTALAVVALRKWRDVSNDAQPTSNELLTKFREVHCRGGLSDDEYRTIKTKLARQLDSELNDTNKTS